MYKNQLQELAQRSCFNLPAYTSIREGPDHAPRFKAIVNFNGETFESPNYCTTLRQAEHLAAEVALNALASRGPSNSMAARILDETGVYKNLLQEVSQRVGASLPTYMTFRSGLGHLPVFTCTVELAGVTFTGESAKTKKQAEKNAALAAWSSLKQLAQQSENSTSEKVNNDEQEHVTVARAFQKYLIKAKMARLSFPITFPMQNARPLTPQPSMATTSKILPLICPKTAARSRPSIASVSNSLQHSKSACQIRPVTMRVNDLSICQKSTSQSQTIISSLYDSGSLSFHGPSIRLHKFPAAGAAPYIPVRHLRPHHGVAPPVTIRNAVPVFSAPLRSATNLNHASRKPPQGGLASPVNIRQVVPVFTPPSVQMESSPVPEKPQVPRGVFVQVEEWPTSRPASIGVTEPLVSKAPVLVTEPLASEAPVVALKEPKDSAPQIQVGEPLLTQKEVEEPLLSKDSITPDSMSLVQTDDSEKADKERPGDSTLVKNVAELKI